MIQVSKDTPYKFNLDLNNRTFGKLKVVKQVEDFVHASGHKEAQWECQCSCGSEPIWVRGTRLINGDKVDCGCEHPARGRNKKFEGKKFGKLTVDHYVGQNKNREAVWYCNCECGGHIELSTREIQRGIKSGNLSCGCDKEEILEDKREKRIQEKIEEKKKKFIGKTFGHLKVIALDRVDYNTKKDTNLTTCFFKCKCDCGNEEEIIVSEGRLKSKNKGQYKELSCGKCAYKYFETNNPNRYDLSGDFGIGYVDTKEKNGNIRTEEFYFDKEDYEKIKRYRWTISSKGYVITKIKDATILLHRLVSDLDENEIIVEEFKGNIKIVDHINRNPGNNRKENLRICYQRNNKQNQSLYSNNKSGVIGVDYAWRLEKWRANITVDGERHYLGLYENKEDAIKARLLGEIEYFNEGYEPQRELFEKYGVSREKASEELKEVLRDVAQYDVYGGKREVRKRKSRVLDKK